MYCGETPHNNRHRRNTPAPAGAVVEVVAGIPLGIAAIVLSSIGLAQKIKHPDKYKKGAFEILGLVFGVICLLLSIIFLAILL